MEEIRKLIDEVLREGYLMSLACADVIGPWVSDVIYIADRQFNLYFISRPEFRHSKAFLQNPKAACSITSREKPEGESTGVQMEGVVTHIQNIPPNMLASYSKKRGSKTPWLLTPGDEWYQFTPKNIDLIYEPLFGYSKKFLNLS